MIDLTAYGYDLPDERIAQYPLEKRDESRLMVIDRTRKSITHDSFKNIGQYIPLKSALVINNSKVVPARLLGVRSRTGSEVEVFLLKQIDDYRFEALLRPLKKIKENELLDFGHGITAELENREQRIVRFHQDKMISALERVGHIPLPPYIKRADQLQDKSNYQTVYAKVQGSVAAATAGLHFTKELITELELQGHPFLETTLHIGYGTFKPVEVKDIREHVMHSEKYELSSSVYATLYDLKKEKVPIVAVGSTSCRVLESVAQTGTLTGETNIFIYPGYKFQMVDSLITNFHLPHSTLLMLVCAFAGYDVTMKAYQEAIRSKYRFYSYGDSMLIL